MTHLGSQLSLMQETGKMRVCAKWRDAALVAHAGVIATLSLGHALPAHSARASNWLKQPNTSQTHNPGLC